MLERNPILRAISSWFQRTFSDPAAVSLFFIIVLGIVFLEFFGKLFFPILISIVIAYLLQSFVKVLEKWHVPHLLAVIIVFVLFIGFVVIAIVGIIPLLWKQLYNLINELPNAFAKSQNWIIELQQKYPKIFGEIQSGSVPFFKDHIASIGQFALKYSLITIPNVIEIILYFVLVPLLVFFFLKDSKPILGWLKQFMPRNSNLVENVWLEVNNKIGAYVRGRVLEIIIIAFVTTITFAFLGLQYSVLLGALVGLAVIVPYIGSVIVTIPVVIIALMQWGLTAHFLYLMIAYALINILDSNILVPYLFSEVMDLHPVVIILSVVVFGAIWGFWGVFFAIPLATLVNAILHAWPRPVSHFEE